MSIASMLENTLVTPEMGDLNTFKFKNPGDQIAGTIQATKWDFKTKAVESADLVSILDETDGQKKDIWLSTVQLQMGLKTSPVAHDGRPLGRPVQAGDQVMIRFLRTEQTDNNRTVKVFGIGIIPGNGSVPPGQAGTASTQGQGQPQAPWANASQPQPGDGQVPL